MRPLNNTSEGYLWNRGGASTGIKWAHVRVNRRALSPLCSLWMTKRSTSKPLHQIFKADYRILIATDGPRAIDLCHTRQARPDLAGRGHA